MPTIKDARPSVRTANFSKFNQAQLSSQDRYGYTYAFHLFTGGQGTVAIGQQSYAVSKGSLLYIPPLLMHSFYSHHEHLLTSFNIYCDLWSDQEYHLSLSYGKKTNRKYEADLLPCPEIDDLPTLYPIHPNPFLIELFSHIVSVFETNSYKYNKEITNSLFHSWLLEYYNFTHANMPFDYRIKKVMNLIDHSGGMEDYETWYKVSGLSKSQFLVLFKKMTGLTPKAYILKIRMSQSSTYLLENTQSITAISELLGYSSIHYFTKVFTEYYGESPSSYRKHH